MDSNGIRRPKLQWGLGILRNRQGLGRLEFLDMDLGFMGGFGSVAQISFSMKCVNFEQTNFRNIYTQGSQVTDLETGGAPVDKGDLVVGLDPLGDLVGLLGSDIWLC